MHHMAWLFTELDIEYNAENRERVDEALRELLRMSPAAKCPDVWRAIKDLDLKEHAALVPWVRDALDS